MLENSKYYSIQCHDRSAKLADVCPVRSPVYRCTSDQVSCPADRNADCYRQPNLMI